MSNAVLLLFLSLCISSGAYAATDLPARCLQSVEDDLVAVNPLVWRMPDDVLLRGDGAAIAQAVLTGPGAVYATNDWSPWLLQSPSRAAYSEAAVTVQTEFAKRMLERYKVPGTPAEVLSNAASAPAQYTQVIKDQTTGMLNRFNYFGQVDGIWLARERATELCVQYLDVRDLRDIRDCPKALKAVVDLMKTRTVPARQNSISFLGDFELFRRISSEPTLVQGAAKATLRILDRASSGSAGGSNLYADLVAAYRAAGLSPAQVDQSVWDVLTFYGLRGASMSLLEEYARTESAKMWLSLYLFPAALGKLDHLTYPSGKAYSYPPEVTSRCAFARPYYFWLSASISRFLKSKGYSTKVAITVAHLLNKLYQFGVQHGLRDPNRIYKEPFGSPSQFGLQTALAFGLAGAQWGAGIRDNQALNVDAGIDEMLKKARALPEIPLEERDQVLASSELKDQLKRYVWFHQLIAPDAYLKSALK